MLIYGVMDSRNRYIILRHPWHPGRSLKFFVNKAGEMELLVHLFEFQRPAHSENFEYQLHAPSKGPRATTTLNVVALIDRL